MFSLTRRWRAPIHVIPLNYLLIPPFLLAVATIIALFAHSDVNVAMLWSQCHAHARVPALSRIPVVGTPLCGLASFFHAALDSLRTTALMAVVLAYVGALCTVCTLESARPCNSPNGIVRNPTPVWLLFNLLGGGAVWQLLIVPAFLIRTKGVFVSASGASSGNALEANAPNDLKLTKSNDYGRRVLDVETVAIPVALALGYYLPSTLMLTLNSYATIVIWLFFPLYVSAIRTSLRWALTKLRKSESKTVYPESSTTASALLYAIPIISSVLAHILVIYNSTLKDDRTEMTRSTIKFIEVDFIFIAFTVLYWVFVEIGWEVPIVMIGFSIAGGPGAGIVLGWLFREKLFAEDLGKDEESTETNDGAESVDEQTPLLQ
ncbi:hypothetical protein S7711_09182 [Stachybotrys chartarum IBT 7711]|uniref:Uncharacterized protein n=1 Tax=Stachybotrys chartarum (strain CBS 109288 / IBT 7711) TaxID=1280523 RepID=A0A084ALS5_STACB|nr:hypothetical protein S7711_09182 [Stachybotrys chartarum IBT 7711]KFA47892.1 hypothetical protein S40293_05190 [Stachybotrys chartarum IBT 40293]KFA79907.1 hypothetical protein S40288_03738 [Stachybotrys chartarum IBT 40288]